MPKTSRFHHIPSSCTNDRWLFEKYFWFHSDLFLISHFVKIMDDLKLFHQKNTQKPINHPKCLRRIPEIWYKKYGGLLGPKNVKILEFQKVEIWKDNMFLKWLPYSFLYFLKYLHDKYGESGPVKSENFGSSKTYPKSIGIWPGTLISHFGII